ASSAGSAPRSGEDDRQASAPSGASGGYSRPGKGKRKRNRRKDPLWARLLVIFGAVLMVLSGTSIVGAKVLIDHATSSIDQQNLIGAAAKTDAEGGDSLDGPIDMLLLRVDTRARLRREDGRADTIIILRSPATHDQAYPNANPRDTDVYNPPAPDRGWHGGREKINSAFFYGAQNGGGWAVG